MRDILRKSALIAVPPPIAAERGEYDAQMAAIFAATTDMVLTFTTEGVLLNISRAASKNQGIALDPGIQRKIAEIRQKQAHYTIMKEGLPAAIREGGWQGETVLIGADSTDLSVSLVLISHRNSEGNIDFVSMVARDISDLKSVEK